MKIERRTALRALLGAAALAAFVKARALPSGGELNYQTSCSVVDPDSVDGFVTNSSPDLYKVRGQVRFKFVESNSMSRPEILVQADSVIPAGDTTRVSRARLSFNLRPNEACLFDVAQAIRTE